VLLVGPCDAGKTTLFHQLAEGSTHLGTVASMQPNEAEGVLASEKVRWGPLLAFPKLPILAVPSVSSC
jgi:signal recognition particle receptor subunit beta